MDAQQRQLYSCKVNDLHIQGLTDFYEESNAKSKVRLKTIENNFCELQMKKIICTSYKMCFWHTFFAFKVFAFVNIRWLVCYTWHIRLVKTVICVQQFSHHHSKCNIFDLVTEDNFCELYPWLIIEKKKIKPQHTFLLEPLTDSHALQPIEYNAL